MSSAQVLLVDKTIHLSVLSALVILGTAVGIGAGLAAPRKGDLEFDRFMGPLIQAFQGAFLGSIAGLLVGLAAGGVQWLF